MPTVNVLFDAESDAVHDRHAAERERLGKLVHGEQSDRLTGAEYSEAHAAWQAHHLACLATFKTQHATVQEYAKWKFDYVLPGKASEIDWEALTSVEEVDQLYVRLSEEAKEAAHAVHASLPIGRPRGLSAFEGGGELRFWRHFTGRELCPDQGSYSILSRGVRTLMTVDRRDGYWHVCFMQDWSYGGIGIPNAIEDLASAVYREVVEQAARLRPARSGLRGWLEGWVPPRWRGAAVHPARFRFYEHLPPKSPFPENFGRVELSFHGGRFSSPRWRQYKVIPRSIASARHELKHDVELRPTWV